jgi:DNA-binding MarR family transcriptional regulator
MTDPLADPIMEAARQWETHGWGEAADGMAMMTSVVRAQQLVMARIDEQLRPLDLTLARFEILRLLAFTRSGSLPMAKLGSRLQVHPTSVTSAVSRLVKQGFVERSPGADDRRVVLATITDEGRRITDRATKALNAQVFTTPGLAPDAVRDLTSRLTALRAGLGEAL